MTVNLTQVNTGWCLTDSAQIHGDPFALLLTAGSICGLLGAIFLAQLRTVSTLLAQQTKNPFEGQQTIAGARNWDCEKQSNLWPSFFPTIPSPFVDLTCSF